MYNVVFVLVGQITKRNNYYWLQVGLAILSLVHCLIHVYVVGQK